MITVDDATALGGASIDVAARVAWVLRMARVTSGGSDVRLRSVAGRIGTSAARLSRLETGRLRDGRIIDGYEGALGLPVGSLRAPVDILCRTFPELSPRDVDPSPPDLDVSGLSRLTERLQDGAPVTGGDWLTWARAMAAPGNIGFPERPFRDLVTRLVSELARSVSHAYPIRYEALAVLRCSAYGHLVLEVAQAEVADPHAQGLGDLMSAVGEAVTPDALDWCLELLADGREHLATGGALAIENMAQVEGPGFWEPVAPRLLKAFQATAAGTAQEEWVAHLVRLVPRAAWRAQALVPSRPLPPPPPVPQADQVQANALWDDCLEAALRIGEETGVGEQPMLARLLYDIAFSHWESHAATSFLLLSAVPPLAGAAGAQVAGLVESTSDPRLRERAARRLLGLLHGHDLPDAQRWLRSPDPVLRRTAVGAAGAAGHHVPADVLHASLRDPATSRLAMYSAGMSGHPDLTVVAGSPDLPDGVRQAAAWWLEHGGRVAQ
jgi:hypothetical protein